MLDNFIQQLVLKFKKNNLYNFKIFKGYGLPVAQTSEGRLASIIYIMFGIPVFLLILAQVGKILSRALQKFYKRLKTAKNKLPEEVTRKMSVKVSFFFSLN